MKNIVACAIVIISFMGCSPYRNWRFAKQIELYSSFMDAANEGDANRLRGLVSGDAPLDFVETAYRIEPALIPHAINSSRVVGGWIFRGEGLVVFEVNGDRIQINVKLVDRQWRITHVSVERWNMMVLRRGNVVQGAFLYSCDTGKQGEAWIS